MTDAQVFVDTNILVYAHDARADQRHRQAQQRLRELAAGPIAPAISAQVLHELYVNLVRLGAAPKAAREVVTAYTEWEVISNDALLACEGMTCAERWKISLWDALILAAAKRAGATILWSEDLNEGQDYDGVVVVNPLREKP